MGRSRGAARAGAGIRTAAIAVILGIDGGKKAYNTRQVLFVRNIDLITSQHRRRSSVPTGQRVECGGGEGLPSTKGVSREGPPVRSNRVGPSALSKKLVILTNDESSQFMNGRRVGEVGNKTRHTVRTGIEDLIIRVGKNSRRRSGRKLPLDVELASFRVGSSVILLGHWPVPSQSGLH